MARLSTAPVSPDGVAVAGEGLEPGIRRFLGALERLRSEQQALLPAGVAGEPAGRVTVAGALPPAASLLEAQPGQLRQLIRALAATERSVRSAPAPVRRHLLVGFAASGGALAELGNAALAGLVQALAHELGPRGATAHLLLPGAAGGEEALARLAAFLLSRRADWLTGTVQAAPGAALPPLFPGPIATWPEALAAGPRWAGGTAPPEPCSRRRGHVIVSGAGTGLGRACALLWAAEHASLSLFDRNPGGELVAAVSSLGGQPLPVRVDVRSAAGVEQALRRARDHFGPASALFVGLGEEIAAPGAELSPGAAPGPARREDGSGGEDLDDLLERGLLGAWQLCRLAPPYFGPEGGAVVVDAGPAPVRSLGEGSLHAMLSRARLALAWRLARELAPAGVRVNAVLRATGGAGHLDASGRGGGRPPRRAEGGMPRQRAVLPRPAAPLEDVAAVVRWLADPACPLSGAALPVDAGEWLS
ncbi:MAG: SDR family NAD(P)-dependent oxidoreductase [Bacillota bacterium]|nr:SDR family NAD(P)-dependent oxidoreductase [Bacillota bacterium]